MKISFEKRSLIDNIEVPILQEDLNLKENFMLIDLLKKDSVSLEVIEKVWNNYKHFFEKGSVPSQELIGFLKKFRKNLVLILSDEDLNYIYNSLETGTLSIFIDYLKHRFSNKELIDFVVENITFLSNNDIWSLIDITEEIINRDFILAFSELKRKNNEKYPLPSNIVLKSKKRTLTLFENMLLKVSQIKRSSPNVSNDISTENIEGVWKWCLEGFTDKNLEYLKLSSGIKELDADFLLGTLINKSMQDSFINIIYIFLVVLSDIMEENTTPLLTKILKNYSSWSNPEIFSEFTEEITKKFSSKKLRKLHEKLL